MGEPVAQTDAELVAAAAGGSETAFRAIYRAYARPVYWVAHGLLGHSSDAEDVMQETFLVAWRKLPGLVLASDSLLPWLVTICRFQSANRMRRQRRDRTHTAAAAEETLADTVDVEEQVISRALVERVLVELTHLSPLDRDIFRLCAGEGYAYNAAAEHLGVSHAVVRNRLSRIRSRLRAVTDPEGS